MCAAPTAQEAPASAQAITAGSPADLGVRFAARVLDVGVVLGILFVLGVVLTGVDHVNWLGFEDLQLKVAAAAVFFGYDTILIGLRGTTVGKQAMGLRVHRIDGQFPDWGAACARGLIPQGISLLTCGLGGLLFFLSPLFDNSPFRRGWYDQIAHTVVVKADS